MIPGTAGLYETIGLHHAVNEVPYRLISASADIRETSEEKTYLYVETKVLNIGENEYPIPPVHINLEDTETGEILQSWTPEVKEKMLRPGETETVKWGFLDAKHDVATVHIYIPDGMEKDVTKDKMMKETVGEH